MDWWATALSWEDERILRTTGVALAVLGAILVSPHGFKRMLYVLEQWVLHVWWAIRGHSVNIHVPAAFAATGRLHARAVAVQNIPPDASVEEKVRILQVEIENLRNTVQGDYEEFSGKISELRALVGTLDQRTEELLARLKKDQEQAASLDAAGLPVITWGILLSGVPQELAANPGWGWFFILVGIVLGVAMFRKTVRDGAWDKKASEA